MTIFDGLPDIFTDPDVGFGESVVYTPASSPSSPVTINAIWSEGPILDGMLPQVDGIAMRVDVRAADVPDLREGDTFERVATGVIGRAVPPMQPDGIGIISIALERRDA